MEKSVFEIGNMIVNLTDKLNPTVTVPYAKYDALLQDSIYLDAVLEVLGKNAKEVMNKAKELVIRDEESLGLSATCSIEEFNAKYPDIVE
jgi:hypothetical protein